MKYYTNLTGIKFIKQFKTKDEGDNLWLSNGEPAMK